MFLLLFLLLFVFFLIQANGKSILEKLKENYEFRRVDVSFKYTVYEYTS